VFKWSTTPRAGPYATAGANVMRRHYFASRFFGRKIRINSREAFLAFRLALLPPNVLKRDLIPILSIEYHVSAISAIFRPDRPLLHVVCGNVTATVHLRSAKVVSRFFKAPSDSLFLLNDDGGRSDEGGYRPVPETAEHVPRAIVSRTW
jgi:hypothetical protein